MLNLLLSLALVSTPSLALEKTSPALRLLDEFSTGLMLEDGVRRPGLGLPQRPLLSVHQLPRGLLQGGGEV